MIEPVVEAASVRSVAAVAAVAVVVVGVVVGGCPKPQPQVDVLLEGETMGSTWHIKIGVPEDKAPAAQAMQTPIDDALERINDEMSTYRPNSEISRFNDAKSTAPFAVSHEFAVVVAKALEVGEATGGAYDITIDPLINVWGFDRNGRRETPPSPEEVAAARAHTGLSLVRVDGDALVKTDPDVRINLGGIAAGFAVDVVARMLDDKGFHDYMVEITGELLARGKNAKGQPWKIGVKTPDIDAKDVVTAVPIVNKALTTSGTYHNFFEAVDTHKKYSHIIDPTTAAPVQTDLVSVTVLYDDAVTADGFDTAFIIVGEEKARAIIARYPGMEALFIRSTADGKWIVSTTTGFPKLDGGPL